MNFEMHDLNIQDYNQDEMWQGVESLFSHMWYQKLGLGNRRSYSTVDYYIDLAVRDSWR